MNIKNLKYVALLLSLVFPLSSQAFDQSSPPNSLVVDTTGMVGVGIEEPESNLHVKDNSADVAVRNVIKLSNNGPVGFEMEDTDKSNSWDFRTAANEGFVVSNIGTPGSKLQINKNGSVFLNGAGFFLNGDTNNVAVAGTHTAIQHIASSSRAVKKDFAKIDAKAVMNKIKDLEVTEWRYIDEAAPGRHIGPMAEDFYKLFKLGADDKHVSATDMASVAIIAAKELQAENNELKERLIKQETSFNKRLSALEKMMSKSSLK